jgi:4-amino-4-deoxy-L-arabinose transferase-like glycosyltransferase
MIAWVIRAASEICGDSEACIRAASPVIHTLSAIVIFFIGRALFGARIGFWSGIVFDTLPGVSYSSAVITTDVPLVLLWSVMLFAWVMLVKRKTMGFAILLGAALGLGLLAKQAMLYALLCIACHAFVSRDAREALKGGRAIVAALIALALFTPNIIWNAEHGFPTVKHTGANIGWQYPFIHPLRVVEYIGVQMGVMGPILFIVLLRASWREIRNPTDPQKVLLLCFSLPILILLLFQAALSRAHGKWTATAYPAATILVTAVMLELGRQLLFGVSLGLHLAVGAMLAAAPAFAEQLLPFERLQFLSRLMGWREVADAVRAKLAAERYGSILVDTREMAGELLYYLRDVPLPIYVWPAGEEPNDHYELTRPFTSKAPEPVLFISQRQCPRTIKESFGSFSEVGTVTVPLIKDVKRELYFCRLADFKGRAK